MDIKVIGSNMQVGDALTSYVCDHLNRHVKKYFENALSSDIHFSKDGDDFKVNIVVNEGVKDGIRIRSSATARDVYGCFNEAMEKAARQLRKYNSRIKNYRREKGGLKAVDLSDKALDGAKYVLANSPYQSLEEIEEEELKEMQLQEKLNIISEKITRIETLTVDQAIMKMDLDDLPTLVFINKDSQRLNVVYHRKDGNISWIDPKL